MTGHIEQQVFAHQPHQIDAGVADMVLRFIFAPPRPHVAVDGVQTLGDRAGAIDIGLLGNNDLLVLTPEPCLPGGTAAAEACTDNQNIDVVFDDRIVGHQ